ncbi:MAG: polysaccharide biosynthesis/export family protein [Gammaproteobacteria bacterium]
MHRLHPAAAKSFVILLLVLGFSYSTISAAQDSESVYHVQPGDLLRISVWKELDLDREVLVRPDGGISFPLAGDVNARGKTVEQLRAELSTRLERFIPDLSVTITVMAVNGNKVYVIGQVNTAGEFIMNHQIDVMQALSMAGGTSPFASLDDILVLRRDGDQQIALSFSYGDVTRGRGLEQNILLQSGDVVVVP